MSILDKERYNQCFMWYTAKVVKRSNKEEGNCHSYAGSGIDSATSVF